jgi:hypothetical protein
MSDQLIIRLCKLQEIEEWKPVRGYEGLYEASTSGRIRAPEKIDQRGRIRKAKMMKTATTAKGYLHLVLYKDRVKRAMLAHRVVALAFLSYRRRHMEINHNNGVKTDNSVSNIEYTTRKKNVLHSYRNGFRKNTARGERIGNSKLTKSSVKKIRMLLAKAAEFKRLGRPYKYTYRGIAKLCNVSSHAIYCIANNKTWRES